MAAPRCDAGSALRLRLVTVLMRENLPDLPNLVRLAADEGVRELFVQQLCHDFDEATLPAGYRPMRMFIDRQRLVARATAGAWPPSSTRPATRGDARRRAAPAAQRRRRASRVAPPPRCDWPWTGAYVSYRGDAMPCCMVGTPDRASFGNVLDDGVAEVWANDAYAASARRFASERRAIGVPRLRASTEGRSDAAGGAPASAASPERIARAARAAARRPPVRGAGAACAALRVSRGVASR